LSDRTAKRRQARWRQRQRDHLSVLQVEVKLNDVAAKLVAAGYVSLDQARSLKAIEEAVGRLLHDMHLDD
jgi:hypothetical protein